MGMNERLTVYLRKGQIYRHSRRINKHDKTDPIELVGRKSG